MKNKIKEYETEGVSRGSIRYYFYCPGCETIHSVNDTWKFNGDFRYPTFAPSVLVTWTEGEDQIKKRCHSFIKEGKIQYLNDCTHNFKGTTIDLPDIEKYV